MKKIIITIITLFSATIFANQTTVLKKAEKQIFELANEKLKENTKAYLDRDLKIKNILNSLIDYDTFAQNTLRGKNKKTKKSHWESLTPEQQKEFTSLFKELIETSWMKELKNFNNQKKKIKQGEKYTINYNGRYIFFIHYSSTFNFQLNFVFSISIFITLLYKTNHL